MILAGGGQSFWIRQHGLESFPRGGARLGQRLEISRGPADDFGDIAVRHSLPAEFLQLTRFEPEFLFERHLLGERLAERAGFGLASFPFRRVGAAALEIIQRAEGLVMLMQFDESGRFGEATAGLFFLLALQVDGDDGAHDEQ